MPETLEPNQPQEAECEHKGETHTAGCPNPDCTVEFEICDSCEESVNVKINRGPTCRDCRAQIDSWAGSPD